ncbi:dihydroorotate oxidase [Streptococcus ovuberis]|uniref:dihydroorotate oxidase (fumarate) n=1 Tax=Streptococcus ovuberis TaxID=1936207 RepID=A0A7X6N0D9_9STRE|nr:dihydroorotate oxidase [Streptococcus ovuberis]NKZ20743.1 dihydroorotate oxidase [Streptococcus ovuberis]
MSKLRTSIGQFQFDTCVMNASGVHCYDQAELDGLRFSSAGTFVTKSATLHAREGNPTPRYKPVPLGSINSMGLPNLGIDFYLDYLKSVEVGESSPFLSITGLSREETHVLLKRIQSSNYDGLVELNLSCPNLVGKPQLGYDTEGVKELLTEVFIYFDQPLGVKLPPYFDLTHFDQIAEVLNQFPLTFINTVNSIGNALYIEDETVVIKPKNGFGGLGGAYIKPTALANVHAFYQRLDPSIAIIGTGGVTSGRDVFEHILCGARLVQVGTALQEEGPAIFDRLQAELLAIMATKGYQSLDDFRGKLQYL